MRQIFRDVAGQEGRCPLEENFTMSWMQARRKGIAGGGGSRGGSQFFLRGVYNQLKYGTN